jgi:hypothetical protein
MTMMTEELLLGAVVRAGGKGLQLYMRPVNSTLVDPKEAPRIYWKCQAVSSSGKNYFAEGYDIDRVLEELLAEVPEAVTAPASKKVRIKKRPAATKKPTIRVKRRTA